MILIIIQYQLKICIQELDNKLFISYNISLMYWKSIYKYKNIPSNSIFEDVVCPRTGVCNEGLG